MSSTDAREDLIKNISNTIEEATKLLHDGKQHLEKLEKPYSSEGDFPRDWEPRIIEFILFCRLIEIKKKGLEALKDKVEDLETDLILESPKEPTARTEAPQQEQEKFTIAVDENADWDQEVLDEEAAGTLVGFDAEAFAKLVQLDKPKQKPANVQQTSVNIQEYEDLKKSIENLQKDFPGKKERSTQKITRLPEPKPLLPAMQYLQKKQSESKQVLKVSLDSKKPKLDQ